MKIALPVFAALLLASCSNEARRGVVLESTIEDFIPNDTVVLTGVRVELLKNAPLYQRLSKEQKITALDDFAKKTNLDPRHDLREIVVAFNGHETVAIARANLQDPAQLEKLLEEQGARRVQAGKYTMLVHSDNAVAFINKTIAIAGSQQLVQKLLQGQTGESDKKRAVLQNVAKLPEDKQVWAVAVGGFSPVKLPETGDLANLLQVFQRLDTLTLTIDVKEGVSLSMMGLCGKREDAKQLHDLLRGLIGFGRLSTPSDHPEMLRFFDGIKVENNDRVVKLNAEVPKDMVDLFLKLSGAAKRGA